MKPSALPEELIRRWDEDVRDKNGKMTKKPVSLMYRRDVPQFRTEFLNRCVDMFNTWHLFDKATPHGNGFANERNTTCQILMILESESRKYDEWQRELEKDRRM